MPNLDRFQAGAHKKSEQPIETCAGCEGDIFKNDKIWLYDTVILHAELDCLFRYCGPVERTANSEVIKLR